MSWTGLSHRPDDDPWDDGTTRRHLGAGPARGAPPSRLLPRPRRRTNERPTRLPPTRLPPTRLPPTTAALQQSTAAAMEPPHEPALPVVPALVPNLATSSSHFRAEIAQAKADMAVVLAESFREDINGLRDALQHANQLITALQSENASLRAALGPAHSAAAAAAAAAAAPPRDTPAHDDHDNDNDNDTDADADADAARAPPLLRPTAPPPPPASPGTPRPPPAHLQPHFLPTRPDMQRPPPEGTLFCNGGPYSAAKTGERSHHNAQLKKELNDWTRQRGYAVKVYRSRLEKKRAKLIISCVLAGRPKRVARSEEEEARLQGQGQGVGGLYRKQRISKLSDCPLRFSLLEMVEGSGTFLVRHVMDPAAQCCNHEMSPTLFLDSDTEA